MIKKISIFLIFSIALFSACQINSARATDYVVQNINKNLSDTALGPSGPYLQANELDAAKIIGIVIQAILGLLGIIFLILMLYAGFNWMTAGGEEEKVKKARSTISKAIVGLVIIISSYAIYYFVFGVLFQMNS